MNDVGTPEVAARARRCPHVLFMRKTLKPFRSDGRRVEGHGRPWRSAAHVGREEDLRGSLREGAAAAAAAADV